MNGSAALDNLGSIKRVLILRSAIHKCVAKSADRVLHTKFNAVLAAPRTRQRILGDRRPRVECEPVRLI